MSLQYYLVRTKGAPASPIQVPIPPTFKSPAQTMFDVTRSVSYVVFGEVHNELLIIGTVT